MVVETKPELTMKMFLAVADKTVYGVTGAGAEMCPLIASSQAYVQERPMPVVVIAPTVPPLDATFSPTWG